MKRIIFILLLASICFGQKGSITITTDSTLADSTYRIKVPPTTYDTTMVWAVVAKNYEVVSISHYWEEAYYGPRQCSTPITLCVYEQIYKVKASGWTFEKDKYYTQGWKKVHPIIVFDYPPSTEWNVPSIDTVRYETKY